MSVSAFCWQSVGAAFLARQLGERAKRWRPERHRVGSGFAVGQEQATAFEINPFPPKRQELGKTAPRQDQWSNGC
jgi:hypothetical protein